MVLITELYFYNEQLRLRARRTQMEMTAQGLEEGARRTSFLRRIKTIEDLEWELLYQFIAWVRTQSDGPQNSGEWSIMVTG
jgi:hypothetical protein